MARRPRGLRPLRTASRPRQMPFSARIDGRSFPTRSPRNWESLESKCWPPPRRRFP
ncbi:unnamed protein product, partial [Nesidiocoris tenuis]